MHAAARRGVVGVIVAMAGVVAACSHASPPTPVSADPSAGDASTSTVSLPSAPSSDAAVTPITATAASGDASVAASGDDDEVADAPTAHAEFYACSTDADCMAVKKNSCCNHGELEAVNVNQAQAYKQSFKCPPPRPMCPMFIRRDLRKPACDAAAKRCVMVAPTN